MKLRAFILIALGVLALSFTFTSKPVMQKKVKDKTEQTQRGFLSDDRL